MIKNFNQSFNKNLKSQTKPDFSAAALHYRQTGGLSNSSYSELSGDLAYDLFELRDYRQSDRRQFLSWDSSLTKEYFQPSFIMASYEINTERLKNNMLQPNTKRLEPQDSAIFPYQDLSSSDRLKSAINRYRYQAELYPDSAIVQTNLGRLYHKNQQWQEAISFYQKAIAIDQHYSPAHQYLAQIVNHDHN
ncbi:MAG: tetratricopeptide repeat protein [Cyanobacteria bacterium P01_F01_bin.143]